MSNLNDKLLSLTPGERINLYEIDLRKLGGDILRITANRFPLTPPKVVRFSDIDNTQARWNSKQAFTVPLGAVLSCEIYYKVSGVHYPNFALFDAATYNNRIVYRTKNINMTSSNASAGTSPISPAFSSIAVAGDYFYARFGGTVVNFTELSFSIVPVFGDNPTTWAATNALTGHTDIAMLKIGYLEGGRYIPCMAYLDPELYVRGLGGANTPVPFVVENEPAQILKVPIWQGNAYTPVPIEVTGFDRTGQGAFPRPRMRLSNLFGEGSQLAQQYGDMRGATVRRRRVFADHLDNGITPDPVASPPADVFMVDRKSSQTNTVIEWELASVLDQQGVGLPGRQILRDTCPAVYRVWSGGAWQYAAEDGCPYTGTAMFDENGQPVTNRAEDKCSHKLKTGCRVRFGKKEALPFQGFPMAGRLR